MAQCDPHRRHSGALAPLLGEPPGRVLAGSLDPRSPPGGTTNRRSQACSQPHWTDYKSSSFCILRTVHRQFTVMLTASSLERKSESRQIESIVVCPRTLAHSLACERRAGLCTSRSRVGDRDNLDVSLVCPLSGGRRRRVRRRWLMVGVSAESRQTQEALDREDRGEGMGGCLFRLTRAGAS